MRSIDPLLAEIVRWAANRGDIDAVGLVGSWARGNPRVDSDIDLMLITADPLSFRHYHGLDL